MEDNNSNKSILYSDTLIPDVFLSEYLPLLTSDAAKVYTFCCFLSKAEDKVDVAKLASRLGMEEYVLMNSLSELNEKKLISISGKHVSVNDIKGQEIDRLYKQRSTVSVDNLGEKEPVILAISNQFFDGNMPVYMYGSIEQWFAKYGFEDPVMLMLFSVCNEQGVLSRSYIDAVAKDWHEHGVKTVFDLENLLKTRELNREMTQRVSKALNRKTPFTQFEVDIIDKWFNEYNFTYEIVEEAMKKTVKIANPNIAYVDKILSSWHENQLKTLEQVQKEMPAKNLSQEDIRRAVQAHYQQLNVNNSMEFETRKNQIFRKIPQIESVYNDINDLIFQQAFSTEKKAVEQQISEKRYEMSLLLKLNDYPEDALVRRYNCEQCKDTGMINGRDCECKQAVLNSL